MPAQPTWFSRIDSICSELRSVDRPYVKRSEVERVLHVSPRRAQQIMAPCVTDRVGWSGLADRAALIDHLQKRAHEDGSFELHRRQKVATAIGEMIEERRRDPKLLVEAPTNIVNQKLHNLPGVVLAPGRITVEFGDPESALQSLLALAMAIQNDFSGFVDSVGRH